VKTTTGFRFIHRIVEGWMGVAFFALAACATLPEPGGGPATLSEPGVPKQLQSRQIIVALAESERTPWDTIAQDLQTRHQLRRVGAFPLTSIGVQCLVFQVPLEQSIQETLTRLRADSRVQLAQPNQPFEGSVAANESSIAYVRLAYGARLIHADQAQSISTGQGVSVVVIDTGADLRHPDLQGRIVATQNFVDGGEPSFATDTHGTAVAGVIGARAAQAGAGLNGIAPDATLTVAKACWYPDAARAKARCSSWTLAKALDFAIHHQAKVINLSLGGGPDELLSRLLTAAEQRGITVVAATREGQDEAGFPAALDTVVPVIACDPHGRVAWPRWRTPAFVVAAPGIEIVAPTPRDRYDLLSGSSLAAAHVTGVVALLIQQDPQRSPEQIRALLYTTARQPAGLHPAPPPAVGIVDACAALARQAPVLACH
jgi:subtilisin family serine protease